MDRKKEEVEELKMQETLRSTNPTIIKSTNVTTTPTDDDTTSIESSDTFETWTLVNDKEKNKLRNNIKNDNENHIDNGEEHQKEKGAEEEEEEKFTPEQEPQIKDSLIDVGNDDFSDGISIISENESLGRISPHPFTVTDHLHDLNMRYSLNDHMDDTILNKMREDMENETASFQVQQPLVAAEEQHLRQRRRSVTATGDGDNHALQKASQTMVTASELVPIVKRGLQGIFYVGVGLALLGLIGKIVNPTWKPLNTIVNSSPSTVELEQKVNDMELQNNLMRAEIDLLNKQVKHLSSLNEPQQQKPSKYKDYKESKTFKAWTGNGDSLKPVDITKQDLKKPYKCPDGSFVEIANMCMEQRPPNEPSLVDQFGQVVEDIKEQSEAFKTFEQVAEELQGFQQNPFEQLQDVFGGQEDPETHKRKFMKNEPIYETNKEVPPYLNAHKHNKYDKMEGKYNVNYNSNKEYKKSLGKGEYRHSKEYKKYSEPKNVHDHSKESNEWKSDQFDNNSKEKKYRKDNSKERYVKDFDNSKENSKENQSKERYNKQKRKYNDDSGEWQEKRKEYREQQRKQNELKYQDNKNWYIKRGDSRENKRSDNKQYR